MLRAKSEPLDDASPVRCARILLAGHALTPAPAGALYWEAESTLVIADLHLEKGAAFASVSMLLPPYDTRVTLDRLAALIGTYAPRRVVVLGDSFHRANLALDLDLADRAALYTLQEGREWYWILANHDPKLPKSVGGIVCTTLTIAGVTLRHEPSDQPSAPEIAGHLHPVVRIARRGEVMRRKCFATDGRRLVMPAFGAYTGGLNVLDAAFGGLFSRHALEAWVLGKADVYPVDVRAFLPD
jgi:DNA ligase-associated metallophosphoesterase